MENTMFEGKLNMYEMDAWSSFKREITNIFGNYKSENYRENVSEILKSYKDMECNTSLKGYFLDCHLDIFPENFGNVSEENEKHFHQNFESLKTLPTKRESK